MKNYSALIFLFFLTLVMAGCDKDDEPTKQERLMAKDWKVTAITASGEVNGIGVNNYDYYNNHLIECQKDNLFNFNSGGVVVVDEGATKCTPTAQQTSQGTWSLTENTTGDILTVGGDILRSYGLINNASRDLKVVTQNDETLQVTFQENVTLPIPGFPVPITMPATINITFTAQ